MRDAFDLVATREGRTMSDHPKSERPAATGRNATDQNQRTASVSTAEKVGNYATADELAKALEILRRPLQDREREFFPVLDGALLIDDGGGMPVECFDDADAVHYFLKWLDNSRVQRAARFEVERRRASITLVKGGDHDRH